MNQFPLGYPSLKKIDGEHSGGYGVEPKVKGENLYRNRLDDGDVVKIIRPKGMS